MNFNEINALNLCVAEIQYSPFHFRTPYMWPRGTIWPNRGLMGSFTCINALPRHWDVFGGRKSGWQGKLIFGPRYPDSEPERNLFQFKHKQHLSQWCLDRCGCACLSYWWEAAAPTACSPVSPSKCTDVWRCPTTWPSFLTWWSTTIRTSQPAVWRWAQVVVLINTEADCYRWISSKQTVEAVYQPSNLMLLKSMHHWNSKFRISSTKEVAAYL